MKLSSTTLKTFQSDHFRYDSVIQGMLCYGYILKNAIVIQRDRASFVHQYYLYYTPSFAPALGNPSRGAYSPTA